MYWLLRKMCEKKREIISDIGRDCHIECESTVVQLDITTDFQWFAEYTANLRANLQAPKFEQIVFEDTDEYGGYEANAWLSAGFSLT